MARSALPESLGEPESALGTAEPLHSHAQVLATGLALAERHPYTVRIGAPTAYWTLVQYPRPAVVLSILLVALVSPAAAADPWTRWEKKEGQAALPAGWRPAEVSRSTS